MTERAVIYKILKVLHHEPKEDDFQKCLIGFQELLSSSDMYADFKTYFNENYVNIVERWATCYRLRCMGTNNFIESFHSSFKMRYLGGKVNNRVDKCLHALLKYARDHIFKRARKLSKQAYPINYERIVSRHEKAEAMDVQVVALSDKSWQIDSQSEEEITYTVELVNQTCPYDCKLTCRPCKTCLHIYECDCVDYLVGLNICKHIHRVIITQCQINNEADAPTESTEQVVGLNEFLVESKDSDSVKSQTEDLLETLNIIKSALSNPDFKQDENVIKGLNTLLKKQLPLLTQAVEGRQKEPANKRAENQLRFFSNKKRKAQPSRLANPDVDETSEIKKSLKDFPGTE